jgi:excinuclease ABC subunit C
MVSEERLNRLPRLPGVYIMKGKGGEVLYIGKAKNLRARVRSYFQETSDTRYTIRFLVSRISDLEYMITTNEKEALILEDTLLKKLKPRYNIRLKDDKTYVSIRLTLDEKFPRILVTRKIKKDSSRYFGPYTSAQKVRDTIKFIRRIFQLCNCSKVEFNNRVRPCLDYQMGICAAPCVGYISEKDYGEFVNGVIMFLEGRNQRLLRLLRKKMMEASKAMEFEKAARVRDQIIAIEETLKEQKVVSYRGLDQDVFAYFKEDGSIAVKGLFVRDGRVVGDSDFFFEGTEIPLAEFFSSFISQFYMREAFIPDEVLIPLAIEDMDIIQEWLSDRKGKKVKVLSPVRGERKRLVEMVFVNAREVIKRKLEKGKDGEMLILEGLKKRLKLGRVPRIIEAFDISNIGGEMAVGAMVTFRDARPDKDRYLLFKVRLKGGPDDYGMMKEVISRRYGGASKVAKDLPDMILVDGGKGQLNIVCNVFKELEIKGPDIVSLAKDRDIQQGGYGGRARGRGERVYLPRIKDPIVLREGTKTDLLLRQIRDEVHRFAISYHKKLRGKGIASILDEIPGIGPNKRKALLTRFRSLEGVRGASVKELLTIKGISERIAMMIKEVPKTGVR